MNVVPTYWKKKEGGLGETLYLSLHSHPLVDCAVVVFCWKDIFIFLKTTE